MRIFALIVALTGLIAPSLAIGAKPATPIRAASAQVDPSSLDTMASFLVPKSMLANMYLAMCNGDYRTRLSRMDGFDAYEAKLPGLTDHMTATLVSYCRASISPLIETEWNQARLQVQQTMTAPQVAKLLPLISPAVAESEAFKIEFTPGGTASDAVKAAFARNEPVTARFEAQARAFAMRPGNSLIMNKLTLLQNATTARLEQLPKALAPIFREGTDRADLSGNAFAAERGFGPIFAAR